MSNEGLNVPTVKRRQLENGAVEEIHTMPKSQYYASLRTGSNASIARNSGNFARSGSNNQLSGRYGTLRKSDSVPAFKPTGKSMTCTVTLLDGSLENFDIDTGSLGQQLLDRVCDHLDLSEKQYFGIRYNDKSLRIWFWLREDKKIVDQLKKNEFEFDFQVKFFPPHNDSIIDDLTRYLFCLQVRQSIAEGLVPASFNILVLLGAYAVQSEAGDFDPQQHFGIDYIKNMPFAPKNVQTDEMLAKIQELHAQIGMLSAEEADRQFMWNSMKLGMYGVDMHKVKDTTGEEVSVGVYHSGVLVYKGRIRTIKYNWPKILKLTYKNKSFFVHLRATALDKRERVLEFKCPNAKLSKRLWWACVEHHRFFRMVDAENPRKPQLVPGFGTRKYKFAQSPNADSNPSDSNPISTPSIILSRPQPRVKRKQTQRKEHESLFSPSGIAPVVGTDDEVFNLDDHEVIPRPDLPNEYWKMCVDDCTPEIGIDPNGLDIAAQEGTGWQGCRANRGVKGPGKYYYEGKVVEDGLVRLGWSTNDASLDLGSDREGFAYGDTESGAKEYGFKRNDGKESKYGQAIHEGDVVGCMIDFDNGKIQFNKNGIPFEPAFKIPDDLKDEAFFPTTSVLDGRVIFNFGDDAMEYLPKGDWMPLSQAPPESLVPNKHIGWRMNPFDATKNTEVSGNGLTLQSKLNGEWNGCRANKGVYDAGKYYYEVVPLEDGLARVGWATDEGSLNLGSDASGFGYGADDDGFGINGNQGKKLNNGEIENYGEPFKKGETVGCFIDLDNKVIKWSKRGQVYKEAYAIPEDLAELRAFYPTASLLNNTLDFNFGQKPFDFYPGPEWTPVCYAAHGNTEDSKKQDPSLYNRPKVDRKEDILELRRIERDKMKKRQQENERIDRQEKERRLQLQKQQEEERRRKELERQEAERLRKEYEEAEQRRIREQREIEEREAKKRASERVETEETYQTVEDGEPEITTETYIDEQGRTVTRTVRKIKKKTITNVSRNVIERTEDETSRKTNAKIRGIRYTDEDDELLLRAIIEVTKFDEFVTVMEGLNDVSLSTR